MTNEEFEGHLMAALHGPNAAAIVTRALAVATSDPALVARVGTLIGQAVATSQGVEHVIDLQMLAHLDGESVKRGLTSRERTMRVMEIAMAKERIVARIQARLRESMSGSDAGRTVAASIFLDLDPEGGE